MPKAAACWSAARSAVSWPAVAAPSAAPVTAARAWLRAAAALASWPSAAWARAAASAAASGATAAPPASAARTRSDGASGRATASSPPIARGQLDRVGKAPGEGSSSRRRPARRPGRRPRRARAGRARRRPWPVGWVRASATRSTGRSPSASSRTSWRLPSGNRTWRADRGRRAEQGADPVVEHRLGGGARGQRAPGVGGRRTGSQGDRQPLSERHAPEGRPGHFGGRREDAGRHRVEAGRARGRVAADGLEDRLGGQHVGQGVDGVVERVEGGVEARELRGRQGGQASAAAVCCRRTAGPAGSRPAAGRARRRRCPPPPAPPARHPPRSCPRRAGSPCAGGR